MDGALVSVSASFSFQRSTSEEAKEGSVEAFLSFENEGRHRRYDCIVDNVRNHRSCVNFPRRMLEAVGQVRQDTVLLVRRNRGREAVGSAQDGLHTGLRATH